MHEPKPRPAVGLGQVHAQFVPEVAQLRVLKSVSVASRTRRKRKAGAPPQTVTETTVRSQETSHGVARGQWQTRALPVRGHAEKSGQRNVRGKSVLESAQGIGRKVDVGQQCLELAHF